jgi:hypothetical protein
MPDVGVDVCEESECKEEVSELALWCHDNNLSLKFSKTKELIVDFRKQREHAPIHITEELSTPPLLSRGRNSVSTS